MQFSLLLPVQVVRQWAGFFVPDKVVVSKS